MGEKELQSNIEDKKALYKGKVHFVLSHSYTVFLFAVVLGVVFDIVVPLHISSSVTYKSIGLIMIIIGSIIVYWAQSTSYLVKVKSKIGFHNGPYKYFRSPTHFGLFIMTLGLALIISSPFSILFTIIAYIITKFIFIKKEERILEEKYGEDYNNYKNKVRNHI